MATIANNGKPTIKTAGSVGDIYVNTNTGKRYRCDFAYKDAFGASEFTWREVDTNATVDIPQVPADKPKDKPEPKPVAEEAKEEPENRPTNQSKHTNYHKQYKR